MISRSGVQGTAPTGNAFWRILKATERCFFTYMLKYGESSGAIAPCPNVEPRLQAYAKTERSKMKYRIPVLIPEAFSPACNHFGITRPKNSEKPKTQIFLDEFMSTSCRLDTPTPAIIPGAISKIAIIYNKLLEAKWRPSGSRDSDSQSQVRHGLRQLFFIYGFVYDNAQHSQTFTTSNTSYHCG